MILKPDLAMYSSSDGLQSMGLCWCWQVLLCSAVHQLHRLVILRESTTQDACTK